MKKDKDHDLSKIYQEGKKELMKIPGVLGVGFGSKETGGITTDEISFRVYVQEKRNLEELSPEELIPKKYKDYRTDVIKIPTSVGNHCQDLEDEDFVLGGISISNLNDYLEVYLDQNPNVVEYIFGSIACVATIDGDDSRNKYAFITNRHVLDAQNGHNGDIIHNPAITVTNDLPSVALNPDGRPTDLNKIGKTLDLGIYENYSYSHNGAPAQSYFIDCASVKINTCISSCCGTHFGKKFKNEIKGLNVNGGNNITGIKHLTPSDINKPVFKVGRTTGKTIGKIVDPFGVAQFPDFAGNGICQNIIIAEITTPNCNGDMFFSDSGDSGTAYVNEDREIIGVHFGHSMVNRAQSFAGHIYPVMHRLGVTPITVSNSSQGQSSGQNAPAMILSKKENNQYFEKLKLKAQETEPAKQMMKLIEKHQSEVVSKVNHSRPVTVTWHRNKGPAFLQHFLKSSRDPDYLIPQKVDGIQLTTLFQKMAIILKEEASYDLRKAIQEKEALLFKSIQGIKRLEDFIDQLNMALLKITNE